MVNDSGNGKYRITSTWNGRTESIDVEQDKVTPEAYDKMKKRFGDNFSIDKVSQLSPGDDIYSDREYDVTSTLDGNTETIRVKGDRLTESAMQKMNDRFGQGNWSVSSVSKMEPKEAYMVTDGDRTQIWDKSRFDRSYENYKAFHPDATYQRRLSFTEEKSDEENYADVSKRLAESRSSNEDFIKEYEANRNAWEKASRHGFASPYESYVIENRDRYASAKREIAALEKELHSNPLWQERRESMAAGLGEMNAALRKETEEYIAAHPDEESELLESAVSMNAYSPIPNAPVPLTGRKIPGSVALRYKDERDKYIAARRLMDDSVKLFNAPSRYGNGNGFVNYLKGMGDTFSDIDFWTRGLTSIADNMQLYDVLSSFQEKFGKVDANAITKQQLDGVFSPAEKALLNAFATNALVQSERASDLSLGYQAGQGTTESLGYMAEFILTGGVGKAASAPLKTALTKWLANGLTKMTAGAGKKAAKVAGKYGVGLLTDAIKTAAMTGVMPSTYDNIAASLVEVTEDGKLPEANKAIGTAIVDSMIEQGGEIRGSKVFSALTGKIAGKIGSMMPDELVRTLKDNGVTRFLREGGYDGLPEEMIEEWWSAALRSVTIDPDALKDFATVDSQLVMSASFVPITLMGGVASGGQRLHLRRRFENSEKKLRDVLRNSGYADDQADYLVSVLRNATPQTISDRLTPIINKMASESSSLGQAKELFGAAADFAESSMRYRTNEALQSEKDKEERDAEKKSMLAQTGESEFWMNVPLKNGMTSQEVQEAETISGEHYFVLGDRTESGEIPVIDANGNKSFLNEGDIEFMSERSSIDDWLSSKIMRRRAEAETERMADDEAAQIHDLRTEAYNGRDINIGTEEAPVHAVVLPAQTAADDFVIVQTDDGATRTMSWNEFGSAIGRPVQVHTDAEIETREADLIDDDRSVRERVLAEETARFIPGTDDGNAKEGHIEEAVDIVSSEEVAPDASGSADIPLKEDGTVDETSLWNQNPEQWALWNDGQRNDGGRDSDMYIANAIGTLNTDIAGLESAYAKEADMDARQAIRSEIETRGHRLSELQNIAAHRNAVRQAPNPVDANGETEDGTAVGNADAPAETIPSDENGRPQYHLASVESSLADIYSQGLTQDEIDGFIDANIAESEKELEKLSDKAPKIGTDIQTYRKAKSDYENAIASAQARIDYWNQLKSAIESVFSQFPPVYSAEDFADGAAFDLTPQTPEELAASVLSREGIRINISSFDRETGFGTGERVRFPGMFVRRGGLTIDQIADMVESLDGELTGLTADAALPGNSAGILDAGDPMAAKNAVINLFSEVRSRNDINRYILRNRQESAQRESEAAYNDYANAFEQEYGMTPEEYAVYSEVAVRDIILHGAAGQSEINSIFAEENANASGNERRTNEGTEGTTAAAGDSGQIQRPDEGTDNGSGRRGQGILHQAQADNGGGPEVGGHGPEADWNADIQDGPAQEAAGGSGRRIASELSNNESGDDLPGEAEAPVQGLESHTRDEIKDIVRGYVSSVISESGLDAEVVDIEIHGSRNRGDAKEDSDLDVVVEYHGKSREDDMFNALNDETNPLEIEGVRIDINPIRPEETGDMVSYMSRSREYDEGKMQTGAPAVYSDSSSDTGTLKTNAGVHLSDFAKGVADEVYSKLPDNLKGRVSVRSSSDGNESGQSFIQRYDIDGKPSKVYFISIFGTNITTNPNHFAIEGYNVDNQEQWYEYSRLFDEYMKSYPDVMAFEHDEAGALFDRFEDALDFCKFAEKRMSDADIRLKHAVGALSGENFTGEEKEIISKALADGTYMKAPNGADSKLSVKQWAQVRTKAFKEWFGDWEKAARIEKLRKSAPVEMTGEEYIGKYELNRDSAKKWIKDNLRGEYVIEDTNEKVSIGRKGINKVSSHSMSNEGHLKSLIAIPDLLKKAVFITEERAEKSNAQYPKYRYYVVGLKIGNADYTAKLTIGVDENGNKYYDHALTEIEKDKLLDLINGQAAVSGFISTGAEPNPSVTISKDSKLLSLLQTNSSKVVDENGEPRVVYHGTPLSRRQITPNRGWQADGTTYIRQEAPFSVFRGGEYSGLIFTSDSYDKANDIASKRAMGIPDDEHGNEQWTDEGYVYSLYLNSRNPFDPSDTEKLSSVLNSMGNEIPTLSFYGGKGENVPKEEALKVASGRNNSWLVTETPEFLSKIRELGYDGLIGYDEWEKYTAVVSPDQIKSATDNTGAFSSENDDIRYRRNWYGGNSGYVGYSMSRRAAAAREDGKYPKTDFKKEYKVSDKAFTMLVNLGYIDDSEWHHTSKYGNKTTFYSWTDESYADIYQQNKKEIDGMARDYASVKAFIEDTRGERYIDDRLREEGAFAGTDRFYPYLSKEEWEEYNRKKREMSESGADVEELRKISIEYSDLNKERKLKAFDRIMQTPEYAEYMRRQNDRSKRQKQVMTATKERLLQLFRLEVAFEDIRFRRTGINENNDIRLRRGNDAASEFSRKYNLNASDVADYADAMVRGNLNGAARAFHEIRRKILLDNAGISLGEFTKIFTPIKKELYKDFGDIDELRQQYAQRILDERKAMEMARRRAEEAAEAERRRLQEFQNMSDEQLDSEYMKAIEAGNEDRMRDLVNEAARRNGYGDVTSEYQGVGAWSAPSNPGYASAEERRNALLDSGTDINVADIAAGYSSQPDDYFANLRAYGNDTPHGRESADAINDAIENLRNGHRPMIKVYRAVPKSVKENKMRNGDWVTPSRKYAQMHGENRLEGDYRIIEQEVPADHLWWDGNDINEWGYDDGRSYAYRNTRNNRKLNDLITRDDKSNIIPLSKRFNARKADTRFRRAYHGSGADFDGFDLSHVGEGHGGQTHGYGVYVTEDNGAAKYFARASLPMGYTVNKIINDLSIEALKAGNGNKESALAYLQSRMTGYSERKMARAAMRVIESGRFLDEGVGRTFIYEVEIPDDTGENYLDWNGSADGVIDRMDISPEEYEANDLTTGGDIYRYLASKLGGNREASEYLSAKGLVGIRYVSEEAERDNANNYVIFNDDDVQITDRTRFRFLGEKVAARHDIEEVNRKFNEQLEKLTEENAAETRLELGLPSDFLLAAGIPEKPMMLYGNKLSKKAKIHGFNILDVKDLPLSLQSPIAVFEGSHPNSFAVLLEMKIGEYNGLVSIETNKKGEVDFNLVSSVFGKNGKGIIKWILDGKIMNIDKEKALSYVSASAPIADATHKEELSSATKIVENFENPKLPVRNPVQAVTEAILEDSLIRQDNSQVRQPMQGTTESIRETCDSVAASLGVDVNYVTRDEMPRDSNGVQQRDAKGYQRGGRIYVCLENHSSEEDAVMTVMHEAIGHKGLRALVGPQNMDRFCMEVFRAASPEVRNEIFALSYKYDMHVGEAVEEYLAGLAEKGEFTQDERSFFRKVVDALMDLLERVGIHFSRPFGVADAKWLLWQSYHALEGNDIFIQSRRAVIARRLGFGPVQDARKVHVDRRMRRSESDMAAINSAAESYADATVNVLNRLRETYVDQYAPLESLIKAVADTTGRPAEIWENPMLSVYRTSSVNQAEKTEFLTSFMEPMWTAVKELSEKTDKGIDGIVRYVMLKHGLERNDKFARRDAKEHYRTEHAKAVSEARKKYTGAELDAALAEAEIMLNGNLSAVDAGVDPVCLKNRETDYSGLMNMFSEYNWYGKSAERLPNESREQYNRRCREARRAKYASLTETEAAAKSEIGGIEDRAATECAILWEKIRAATGYTLQHQYKAGMLSKESYDRISSMFEYYVPLRGFEEDTAEDIYQYYNRNASSDFTPPLAKAKGRKSVADNPFAQIGVMAESAIQQDNNNKAKLALYYFVSNRPGNDLVSLSKVWYELDWVDSNGKKTWKEIYPDFTEVGEDGEPRDPSKILADFESRMKRMQETGTARQGRNKLDINDRVVHVGNRSRQEHMISVMVNGEKMNIIVQGNPRAAQAMNGLLNPDSRKNILDRSIGVVTRFMANNFTSRNPEFWISNLQRDLLFSYMNVSIREGGEYAKKYRNNISNGFKAVVYSIKHGEGKLGSSRYEKLYKEFVDNGGVTGYTRLASAEEYEDMMRKYLKSNERGKLVQGICICFDKLRLFSEGIENIARFTAYMTSREMGKDISGSVMDAKNITVNFNRKGSASPISWEESENLMIHGRKLNMTERVIAVIFSSLAPYLKSSVAFFNAAIQSLSMQIDIARRNPKRFAAWMAGYLALGILNAMLHAMLDDDDDYLDMPDWERRNNFLVGANGFYLKWAIPQESRPFYAMGDILVNWSLGRMRHKNVFVEATESFAEIMPPVMPTAFQPVMELVMNKDYMGAPIYKKMPWDESNPAYQRVYRNTNEILVGFSELLNTISGGDYATPGAIGNGVMVNPGVWQHFIEGATGGTGQFIMRMLNTPFLLRDKLTGEEEWSWRNTPLLNRVIVSNDDRSRNSYLNDVYWHYKEIYDSINGREKKYRKMQDAESLQELHDSPEYEIAEVFRRYEKELERYDDMIKEETDDAARKQIMSDRDEYVLRPLTDDLMAVDR